MRNPADVDISAEFVTQLELDPGLRSAMQESLPEVSRHTVTAIMAEVPAYHGPFTGPMGATIEQAVHTALDGFLRISSRSAAATAPLTLAINGAFQLGKNEAVAGRSADALLAAYRVGARVAWRELSTVAVHHEAPAQTLADFAEMVFAYIDQLSAASVQGHSAEIEARGRLQQRSMERLVAALLRGASQDTLLAAADRANWRPNKTLTAVILKQAFAGTVNSVLGSGVLQSTEDLPGLPPDSEKIVLLVPDVDGRARTQLIRAVRDAHAVVGPPRPWHDVSASYARALRARGLVGSQQRFIDTEQMLPDLVRHADPEALEDLRQRVLAPLHTLRPPVAAKLTETLRAWILHQGRREEIADALFVHPQTIRYRMGQLRELFGDDLEDPQLLFELILALGSQPT
jgi:hypothetical protein